jgi:hypothetical protein
MPAKDYKLCVSGLMGTPFIAKVSKTNKNLMLSDRREIPKPEMYVAVEQFFKADLEKDNSIVQVTAGGKLIYEVHFPDKKADKRRAEMHKVATTVLELTKGYTPEQREFLNEMHNMLNTMEELAGYVQALTS